MKHPTREWVEKAEGDFQTLQREVRARKNPNFDAACFHAQQCVEKYLKARLQEAGVPFPKSHDLKQLLVLVAPVEPLWQAFSAVLDRLNVYAVQVRYPGRAATREMARESLRIAKQIRSTVRDSLGARG